MDRIATFAAIMESPNPLTKAELAKLIDKHPERYSMFAKWLDKLA